MSPGRTALLAAVAASMSTLAACERRDTAEAETGPLLTLAVETPEALYWGGSGVLRVTLANEGDAMSEGGVVEVWVPGWLEFGHVEPPGTAVTVVGGDDDIRLLYQLTDSLPPGERRTIMQHLRVHLPAPAEGPVDDDVETVQLPPANQVVRARLLSPAGEPAGVEVQATLHFVRTPPMTPDSPVVPGTHGAPGAAGDTFPPPDTLPPSRPDTTGTAAATPPSGRGAGRSPGEEPGPVRSPGR